MTLTLDNTDVLDCTDFKHNYYGANNLQLISFSLAEISAPDL